VATASSDGGPTGVHTGEKGVIMNLKGPRSENVTRAPGGYATSLGGPRANVLVKTDLSLVLMVYNGFLKMSVGLSVTLNGLIRL